jgi:hypothetical protein
VINQAVTSQSVTIPYFAGNQDLVFVPALLVLLVATVLICLPIVFAPSLRRAKRRRPLLVLAGVLAAASVVGAAVLAGAAFRTLGDERTQLQADLRAQYGVQVTSGDANELINGGKPLKSLPQQAAAARLPNPTKPKTLKLKATQPGADTYDLLIGGQPWPS